jgi:hypothetical protein
MEVRGAEEADGVDAEALRGKAEMDAVADGVELADEAADEGRTQTEEGRIHLQTAAERAAAAAAAAAAAEEPKNSEHHQHQRKEEAIKERPYPPWSINYNFGTLTELFSDDGFCVSLV